MKKQKLEQYLKDFLKQEKNSWYLKLQNSHFAPTPADFIILTPNANSLIECKQIEYKNDKTSFSFERLTQENELLKFEEALEDNYAFLLLMFWNKRLKNSFIYLIPITQYIYYKNMLLDMNIKSFNIEFLEKFMNGYKINVKNGTVDLSGML
jgi:hypothetical protein